MRLTQKQQQFIINSSVERLVELLQEEHNLPILEAFNKVYTSNVYKKLTNTVTGLYLQSPEYVYDYLEEEMR